MRTKPPSNRIFEPKSPEEIQELTREAAKAQDQILKILRSIKEGQQSLIKKLAKDLGIPGEHDTNRLIWHAVILYANAELRDPNSIVQGIKGFGILTTLCVSRLVDPLEFKNPLADLSPFKDLK